MSCAVLTSKLHRRRSSVNNTRPSSVSICLRVVLSAAQRRVPRKVHVGARALNQLIVFPLYPSDVESQSRVDRGDLL